MYVDEKRLIQLAEQVNLAFKAQELAMEELTKKVQDHSTKLEALFQVSQITFANSKPAKKTK